MTVTTGTVACQGRHTAFSCNTRPQLHQGQALQKPSFHRHERVRQHDRSGARSALTTHMSM